MVMRVTLMVMMLAMVVMLSDDSDDVCLDTTIGLEELSSEVEPLAHCLIG